MKSRYLLLSAALVCMTGACGHTDTAGHDHQAKNNVHSENKAHAGNDIVLDPEMAERLGVSTDTAKSVLLPAVAKVSGVIETSQESTGAASATATGVLRLAPGIETGAEVRAGQLIGTVSAQAVSGGDVNRAAKAEFDAARAELERIRPLWAERLVTRAQYNEAVAAYERARASYSAPAASGRITAPVSGVITSLGARSGQVVATGDVVATVSGSQAMTLRVQVPAREYAALGNITDARVVLPYDGGTVLLSEAGGRRTGASAAGASGGYVPVVFTFSSENVLPGTAVEVYVLGQAAHDVIAVPESAIVEQQGDYFVYIRLDNDCYARQPVELGAGDGSRREIRAGLKGGEAVVSRGTTAITLAAAAGNVPEGHSHQH